MHDSIYGKAKAITCAAAATGVLYAGVIQSRITVHTPTHRQYQLAKALAHVS